MKKIITFIVLSLFWILLLFPKDILWNDLANYTKKQGIDISSQAEIDKKYKFIAINTKIYFQKVEIAILKKVEIKFWVFYNQVEIQNAKLDKNIPILKGLGIQNAKLIYTIFSPRELKIEGFCTLGHFMGKIDIFKHKGYVLLKNNSLKDNFIKQYFKKTKDGMRYEFIY